MSAVENTTMAAMLLPQTLAAAASEWLTHDVSSFDVGGAVVGSGPAEAVFWAKSPMVISGFPFAEAVLESCKCTVSWEVKEGTFLADASGSNRICVGVARGPVNHLLQAERTALEVITRSSACATYAYKCVAAARRANPSWSGTVAATRKTSPGALRLVEKYGAIVGGADPHRYNLSSMVMLKDNHVDACGGSIAAAVKKARKLCGFSTKIEVECRSEEDAIIAASAGADVVMLDNFTPEKAQESATRLRQKFPTLLIELSGGITLDTVGSYAVDGVNVVSIGKITHGPPPCDVSMKIRASKSKL